MIDRVRFCISASIRDGQTSRTYSIHTSEAVQVSRLMNQHIPLMDDGSLDDGVFLFEIVAVNIAVELSKRVHRSFLITLSGMEPGRFGNPYPELLSPERELPI